MQIDEARFAAATMLTSGAYLKFDDIGEMLTYHMEHPQDQVTAWFVHDYQSESWLRGEEAFFARSADLQTPMGSGIAAFAEQADAEAFAREHNGQVFSLDELRADVHMQVHGSAHAPSGD
jgi:copper chaperone NosL